MEAWLETYNVSASVQQKGRSFSMRWPSGGRSGSELETSSPERGGGEQFVFLWRDVRDRGKLWIALQVARRKGHFLKTSCLFQQQTEKQAPSPERNFLLGVWRTFNYKCLVVCGNTLIRASAGASLLKMRKMDLFDMLNVPLSKKKFCMIFYNVVPCYLSWMFWVFSSLNFCRYSSDFPRF